MALNWIKPEEFSFNSFLLMERFQIRLLCQKAEKQEKLKTNLGIALQYNSHVKWYFEIKCPECKSIVEKITKNVPMGLRDNEVRNSEIFVILSVEDFAIYTRPELMATDCDFIRGWKKEYLLELTDFTDKVVLDIGSGSGRLTFAAATVAKHVYASEPVDTLREYMRDKIARGKISNISVIDGMIENIPYPDNTFDIVMSGHVWGDYPEKEYDEMVRVVKNGGYIIDCRGEDERKMEKPNKDIIELGFEYFHYTSIHGGDVYRYMKQIHKTTNRMEII